jgi:2-haloacid dehalogenase
MSGLLRARWVEYSSTYSLMGNKREVWNLTQLALDYSVARFGLTDDKLRAALLNAYLKLRAYPEVTEVLSNGNESMVRSAVRSAGIYPRIALILLVDDVEIYKPHPIVYEHAPHTLDVPPNTIRFQSCNPRGAANAASRGFGQTT